MKISELITELQILLVEFGDLPVTRGNVEGEPSDNVEITSVDILSTGVEVFIQ